MTDQGTTYVVPSSLLLDGQLHLCILENSLIVRLLAKDTESLKHVRYIEDGVRPCFRLKI